MVKLTLTPFLMDDAILAALKEDVNEEDISTNALVDADERGSVKLFAKADGVLAGAPVLNAPSASSTTEPPWSGISKTATMYPKAI